MKKQEGKGGVPIPRSSKISMALRKNFINSHLEEGLSIKKAAAKYKLNYSTAKVIAQRYKAEKAAEERLLRGQPLSSDAKSNVEEQEKRLQEQQKYRCSYKKINTGDSASGSESTSSSKQQKIIIISTVAWDFMRDGLPSFN